MKILWVAINGPGVRRMTTWTGKTRRLLVTGIDRQTAEDCSSPLELPQDASVVELQPGETAAEGYVFTVFEAAWMKEGWRP